MDLMALYASMQILRAERAVHVSQPVSSAIGTGAAGCTRNRGLGVPIKLKGKA